MKTVIFSELASRGYTHEIDIATLPWNVSRNSNARKQVTQVLDRGMVLLPFSSYEEQISGSTLVIELSLPENVKLLFPSSDH